MHTTPIYASLLALLLIALSARVIGLRRSAKVGVGDGGDRLLQRAIRVHGNFCEYVPFALLLMAMAEFNGLGGVWIHVLGLALLAARVLHALGVSQLKENLNLRVCSVSVTFSVIAIAAVANLVLAF